MNASIARLSGAARTHPFYFAMACAIALIAFVGFAPTYYLSALFRPRQWPPIVHVHAVLSTSWVGVLLTQAALVRAGLTHLHRSLGVVAILIAIPMLPVGTLTAIGAARRGLAPAGIDPLTFMIVPIGALVVFAVLLTIGIVNRHRPEWHKRSMLIATFAILTPAIARFSFVGQRPAIALGLTCLLVVVVAARDFRLLGRIHPATLWGGGLLVASVPLRFVIGHTSAWHTFAARLVG
jgi:hypothetical protein